MSIDEANTAGSPSGPGLYRLRRQEGDSWRVTYNGAEGQFAHERGALYVAYLLLVPARAPVHAAVLALHARNVLGSCVDPEDVPEERAIRMEVPATVLAMWSRQRELERVIGNAEEPEPVRAEALRELGQIAEYLQQTPWISSQAALRHARNVGAAILRLFGHLTDALGADGRPDEVLRAFGTHLRQHLLACSARGPKDIRVGSWAHPGWFVYVPPQGLRWEVQGLPGTECAVRSAESGAQGSRFEARGSKFSSGPSAAAEYLSRFVCLVLGLALLATGCASIRPLHGGKALFAQKPSGAVVQSLTQSENPAQSTRQGQEHVTVRTYTVPAGSRMEESSSRAGGGQECASPHPRPPTLAPHSSSSFTLSAPMPVVEREESRVRTELGAAQKDMAREMAAKLSSLKGIVWVGVGLFIFGLASLVWPPLKLAIGSVTTSVALMLGGVALMALPSMLVGHELLILGIVALAVGGWFLAHRHGELRGRVRSEGRSPKAEGSQ
jgi:hypothetical protein